MINVFGKNVIYELLNTNLHVYKLYLRDDIYNKDKYIINKAHDKNIEISVLNKEKFNNLFKGLNQGYGATIDEIKTYDINDLIRKDKKQIFLILDQLEDPNNLGAIMRTCDAFSIDGIIVPNKGNIRITDTVIKVSTGAAFYVPLCFVSNINQTIMKLKEKGVWVCGADMDGEVELKDLKYDRSLAIVIGSEGFGIRDLVRKNCDYIVSIKMTGHVNSLNASVSAAVILSHLVNLQ